MDNYDNDTTKNFQKQLIAMWRHLKLTNNIQECRDTVEAEEGDEPAEESVEPELDPVKGVLRVEHLARFAQAGMEKQKLERNQDNCYWQLWPNPARERKGEQTKLILS